MVDEVGVVKGLSPDKSPDQVGAGTGRRRGGYGVKEEFSHAKSATAAMGVENVSILAPLDLPPPKQGCCSAGGGLLAYAKALCQMSKCGAGEEGLFCRGRFDIMQNVEMWELEKEMDKDGSVVFGVGWATR